MKDNLIKIDNVLLTLTELIIAFVLLSAKSMTVAEAAAEGCRRDAAPVRDVKGLSYAECAQGNTACEMLILAGIAEWDNKTRSRIRVTQAAYDVKDEIAAAYREWFHTVGQSPTEQAKTAGLAWDKAVSTASLTENTVDLFPVGTLVRYKKDASRNTSDKRLGVVIGRENTAIRLSKSIRLVHVNWGAYGAFWDRVRNLEVVNASR